MKTTVEEFAQLCRSILERHAFTKEEADVCTEEIVDAQSRGHISHGASIIPEVIEWKKVAPKGPIEIRKETPVSAFVLGNNNIGPLVAKRAMDIAIEKAIRNGVGIVGVNNKTPFMLAGYNPRRAAEKGLIGINWSVAFSKVAPWGSADPIIGTNPLGIAVPASDRVVVLDMAITEIPAAEIRRSFKLDLPLPSGVAITKDGVITTDPREALEGSMLPFGKHKGSGLGIMIELLGGPFVGAKAGKSILGERGMVFLAMKTDLFVEKDQFLSSVDSFVREVKASRPRKGFEEVMLPGEHGDKMKDEALVDGLEIEQVVYSELLKLAS